MKVLWLWLCVVMAALTAGSAGAAQRGQFVYAATDAGTIHQYRIGNGGALHPLTPPRVQVSRRAIMLVLHPSGRFAYAVTVHQFQSGHAVAQIFSYRVNRDGTLALLRRGPRFLAAPADNVTMDPKGRFLFVSGEDRRLFTLRIRHDGALVPLADNVVEGTFFIDRGGDDGGEAIGVTSQDVISLDPAGRFLYLFVDTGFIDHHEYRLASYRLDGRGALHRLAPISYGQGYNEACFSSPHGGLFVVRDGTSQYRIGAHGRLAPAAPPVVNGNATLVTEAADGETLWAFSFMDARFYKLSSYRIGARGRLTLRAAHAATLPAVAQMAASGSGRLLYVADQRASLRAYAVTPQGTLRALSGAPEPLHGVCLSLRVGAL